MATIATSNNENSSEPAKLEAGETSTNADLSKSTEGPIDTNTLEAGEDSDPAESVASETDSLASSIIKGHIENGRRYSTLREDYWGASDETQFETMDLAHMVYLILLSDHENMLFRAPVQNPAQILDIGTGPGTWAVDVADHFPEATVHGVDIYPPPVSWVPPNCFFEVDDVTKNWTWRHKFDLIHMRYMVGAFTDEEWVGVYQKAYDALVPGGWIEQLEPDGNVHSDDGSVDPHGALAKWGSLLINAGKKLGRSLETVDTFLPAIEKAGFVNIHDHYFKCPLGRWPKDKRLKEAGRINYESWNNGLEGFALLLLTRFGEPEPWTKEEVFVYLANVRRDFQKPGTHPYHFVRRVWAQKPLR